ncbi:metal ABC transporter ATP-binding protein [candidate division KSB1 bacterium]
MERPVIDISSVSFSYNDTAVLDDISLTVHRHDFVGIIGPNGGGKTTLLKLLLGLLEPEKGSVRVLDNRPRDISMRLGYVPQNTDINQEFPVTVKEVALMGRLGAARRFLRYSRKDLEAVERALQQVDMWEYRNVRIGDLSAGQRQRVFIARALTSDPEIMFLDEPTASVDPAGQVKLFDILKTLNKDLTILFVSHGLNILLDYVNKVACVNRQLVFHDAPHVTSEMLDKTFGFSIEQICPLEELPPAGERPAGH